MATVTVTMATSPVTMVTSPVTMVTPFYIRGVISEDSNVNIIQI